MSIIVLFLLIPTFVTAMETKESDLVNLGKDIQANKETYMTFNSENPIIKELRSVFAKELGEQQLESIASDPTCSQNLLSQTRINCMQKVSLLLSICMKEIKKLGEKNTEYIQEIQTMKKQPIQKIQPIKKQNIQEIETIKQQNMNLIQEVSNLKNQETSLIKTFSNTIDQQKRDFNTQIDNKNRALKLAILYRNIFALGFLVSTVGFLNYYIFF